MPEKETGKSVVQRKERSLAENKSRGINYLFVIAVEDYQYCPKLYNCVEDAIK